VLLAELQTVLETITWLDTAYGQSEKHHDQQEGVYPTLYAGGDYLKMKPDEHLGNICFFMSEDPQKIKANHLSTEESGMMKLVFFFNWENVYVDHTQRTYENIKYDVLEKLRNPGIANGRIEVKAFYKDALSIWKGYKVDPSMRPYGVCAFDIEYKTYGTC